MKDCCKTKEPYNPVELKFLHTVFNENKSNAKTYRIKWISFQEYYTEHLKRSLEHLDKFQEYRLKCIEIKEMIAERNPDLVSDWNIPELAENHDE